MTRIEEFGEVLGRALQPMTERVAKWRHSRVFHPVGKVLRAEVVPLVARPTDGLQSEALHRLGQRVSGPALVRFSGAWWKRREWIDALGCAIRMRATDTPSADPEPGDQDLLFATIRFPVTTLLAPLSTEQHDFLGNYYYAVSPFDADDVGRVKLRLAPTRHPTQGENRFDRLERAAKDGSAAFRLELKLRRPASGWQAVADVRLHEPVDVDQRALRFWPFRDGRGIHPRGLVHAMRRGAYLGSYHGRDSLH